MILEKVSCTNFSADASSSGDVSVKNLNAADVSADASSSGDVILAGICENASLQSQ